MGIFYSKNDVKFFEDCEKRLSQVDESLTSLAYSIDAIHRATEVLIKELERTFSTDTDEEPVMSLTSDLLSKVEGALYQQKIIVLKGISELIHALAEKANEKISLEKHIPTLQRGLDVDEYISNFQKKKMCYKETLKLAPSMSNGTKDTCVDDGVMLEELEKDIKQLKRENEKLKFTNTMLKTESDAKLTEANNSKDAIEKKCERLDSELNSLKEENKKLQESLQKALCKVETIPVQVYYQRRGSMIGHIEEELRTKLNDHLILKNRELELIRCETTAEIQPDKPLLVMCISTSRLGTDAKSAVLGVSKLEHCALLIFHHKHEYALPSQSSERVLAAPDFKAICGIFDLAFLTEKGIYNCEMNNRAITAIVDFICKVFSQSSTVSR